MNIVKRTGVIVLVAAGAMMAQYSAETRAPGQPESASPDSMQIIRRRALFFNAAWLPFTQRLFNCTGPGCQGPGSFSTTDFVKSCEQAKQMFGLNGNCRDRKKLEAMFRR